MEIALLVVLTTFFIILALLSIILPFRSHKNRLSDARQFNQMELAIDLVRFSTFILFFVVLFMYLE